jgi:hypothetical protein
MPNFTSETYKVIFSGKVIGNQSAQDVSKRFAEAFKLSDQASLEQLFSGKIITLKRGLGYEQAQRYSHLLQKMGADCCIEREYNPLTNDSEPDYDYERKKRRRLAQFAPQQTAELSLAPK